MSNREQRGGQNLTRIYEQQIVGAMKTVAHVGKPRAWGMIANLADLPVVVTLEEVCAIYRRGTSTIRRQLQLGTFEPPPFDVLPYRWLRDDIEKDLKTRAAKARAEAVARERDRKRSGQASKKKSKLAKLAAPLRRRSTRDDAAAARA